MNALPCPKCVVLTVHAGTHQALTSVFARKVLLLWDQSAKVSSLFIIMMVKKSVSELITHGLWCYEKHFNM